MITQFRGSALHQPRFFCLSLWVLARCSRAFSSCLRRAASVPRPFAPIIGDMAGDRPGVGRLGTALDLLFRPSMDQALHVLQPGPGMCHGRAAGLGPAENAVQVEAETSQGLCWAIEHQTLFVYAAFVQQYLSRSKRNSSHTRFNPINLPACQGTFQSPSRTFSRARSTRSRLCGAKHRVGDVRCEIELDFESICSAVTWQYCCKEPPAPRARSRSCPEVCWRWGLLSETVCCFVALNYILWKVSSAASS